MVRREREKNVIKFIHLIWKKNNLISLARQHNTPIFSPSLSLTLSLSLSLHSIREEKNRIPKENIHSRALSLSLSSHSFEVAYSAEEVKSSRSDLFSCVISPRFVHHIDLCLVTAYLLTRCSTVRNDGKR